MDLSPDSDNYRMVGDDAEKCDIKYSCALNNASYLHLIIFIHIWNLISPVVKGYFEITEQPM